MTKELQKELLKEGIDILDLPIGIIVEYEGVKDISLIPQIVWEIQEKLSELEQINQQEEQDFINIINSYNVAEGTNVLEVYPLESEDEYINNLDNVSDLKEIIYSLKDDIEQLKQDLNIKSQGSKGTVSRSDLKGCNIDISGREKYKIPVPSSKEILSNKNIDFKLLYIIASTCEIEYIEDGSIRWYTTKDTIKNSIKPMFNKCKDTFNKKFKAIRDAGILTEDKESGEYEYNYSKDRFVQYDIEKIMTLLLDESIKENTYRILTYMLIYCRNKKKTLSYEFIIKGIGLKNLNRQTIKELIEPLEKLSFIRIEQTIVPLGINYLTKNYYEVI